MDNITKKDKKQKSISNSKNTKRKRGRPKKVEIETGTIDIDKADDVISKCIEDAIKETKKRKRLYVVYDEGLNKWKAIKEQGKRAIKMANTRTGLLNEVKPIAKKEDFEIIVLKKKDIKDRYNDIKK